MRRFQKGEEEIYKRERMMAKKKTKGYYFGEDGIMVVDGSTPMRAPKKRKTVKKKKKSVAGRKKVTAGKKAKKKKAAGPKKAKLSRKILKGRKELEAEVASLHTAVKDAISKRKKIGTAVKSKLKKGAPLVNQYKVLHNENKRLLKKLDVAVKSIEKIEQKMIK